jgi:hypothetical protein
VRFDKGATRSHTPSVHPSFKKAKRCQRGEYRYQLQLSAAAAGPIMPASISLAYFLSSTPCIALLIPLASSFRSETAYFDIHGQFYGVDVAFLH